MEYMTIRAYDGFLIKILNHFSFIFYFKSQKVKLFMKMELQKDSWPKEVRLRPRSCIENLSYNFDSTKFKKFK